MLKKEKNESFIKEIQEFPNIGPIVDLKVIEEEYRGVFDIITCSGTGISGGFRKITKGVNATIELQMPISNITGLWTLSLSSNYHTSLIFNCCWC